MIALLLSRNFWLGLLIAGALGGLYGQANYWRGHAAGYRFGEQVTTAKYEAALQGERERVDAANAEARALQRQRFANLMDLIRRKDDLLEELDNEAVDDPRADDCGLSGDGLRRVNRS